jgi:hypothetical protein
MLFKVGALFKAIASYNKIRIFLSKLRLSGVTSTSSEQNLSLQSIKMQE